MRVLKQTTAAIAAAMLLAASPAAAELNDDEVEAIFVLSKEVCPGTFAPDVEDAGEHLMQIIAEEQLNTSQSLLLMNFCLMYGEGLTRGISEG